ncbi:SIMPL domain-containing protein [Xanthocytophaga agilis]|uniref:SIMPL domain-containing protein n=1 Tax=Xanthocytophaga agilis TaxID=3048010 RepID=A0AAE3R072_9BACT|nr:SIMPL domain-containing protein [Xanthocytophaga agilis]MDJ1501341.1 SIMPL domain-containing protein [Xanthocytophaga agilis]
MKKIAVIICALFITQTLSAQNAGNLNYHQKIHFPNENIALNHPTTANIFIQVKGLANIKADAYVAIFSVTQTGKTTEEVNELLDKRITQPLTEIKLKKEVETYTDMVSFVPIYEFEIEKKSFSKRTYNEIPTGFELKKNIHIKFSESSQLNDIITILAKNEIYDLVRVDYFSSTQDAMKKDLMTRAKLLVQEKMKNYEALVGESFVNVEKQLTDGYRVALPVEMYNSYEAYSSSALNLRKPATINQSAKSTTLYYQPIVDKEFDFVINPVILEPVIQILYEVTVMIKREKKSTTKDGKEYILVTPNGEMKNLDLKNENEGY